MRQIPYTMMKFACFEKTIELLYRYGSYIYKSDLFVAVLMYCLSFIILIPYLLKYKAAFFPVSSFEAWDVTLCICAQN
jgi:hypothetical protein